MPHDRTIFPLDGELSKSTSTKPVLQRGDATKGGIGHTQQNCSTLSSAHAASLPSPGTSSLAVVPSLFLIVTQKFKITWYGDPLAKKKKRKRLHKSNSKSCWDPLSRASWSIFGSGLADLEIPLSPNELRVSFYRREVCSRPALSQWKHWLS